MSKQLAEIYPKIKDQNPYFEIIFCSYDRSEDSFKEYFGGMPWVSLPYGSEKPLANAFDVQGLFLIVLFFKNNFKVFQHFYFWTKIFL
jgi:hypothetical protein